MGSQGVGGSGREWKGVGGSGREWEGVGGSGREWEGVGGSRRKWEGGEGRKGMGGSPPAAVLLVGSVKWGGRGVKGWVGEGSGGEKRGGEWKRGERRAGEGREGEGKWEDHRQQPVPHSQPAVLLVVSVKWGGRGGEGRGVGGSPPAACPPQLAGRPAGWECEVGREGRGGEGSGRLTASSLSPTASRTSCWLGV